MEVETPPVIMPEVRMDALQSVINLLEIQTINLNPHEIIDSELPLINSTLIPTTDNNLNFDQNAIIITIPDYNEGTTDRHPDGSPLITRTRDSSERDSPISDESDSESYEDHS